MHTANTSAVAVRACLKMLLAALFMVLATTARSEPVLLDGSAPARLIGQSLHVYPDPDDRLDFERAWSLYQSGAYTRSEQTNIDFGYNQIPQWIAIPLENTTDISVTYILSTNWPFINSLEAQLRVPGREPQLIVNRQADTPYGESLHAGMSLISEQFLIPPRSEATIVARFQPFAFGILPISLETPATSFQRTMLDNWGFALFYSGVLAAAFIFMLFVIAVRHAGGIYFMGIIVSGILIIAQLDGFFFAYLWPNAPLWDRVAPFHFMLFVNFTSFALAAYMFREADMETLAAWMNRLMWASLLPGLGQLAIDVTWMIVVGYIFLVIAMGALLYAIITWTQILPRKRQIALLLGIAMLAIVGAIVWSVMAGLDTVNFASHNLIKLLYVVMVLSCIISYATHIAALNRNYAASLKRQLELARKEASMNAELLQSERKFAEAQELVARHKHRLATTSHDLKQPIASLRLTLDAMAKSGGKAVEENVARAFDYLEDLVNENLQEERIVELTEDAPTKEVVELDLVFETIRQMFEEEAISKGIRLSVQPSGLTVEADTVPLMRIISNLVSNAIKHTLEGTVRLSADRSPDAIVITIADTGPGMSREEIDRFTRIGEKGNQSTGSGLGLAICFDIARDLGMELQVHSRPDCHDPAGTQFVLTVPEEENQLIRPSN